MMASKPAESDMTTSDIVVQNRAPWGLARISHQQKLSFDTFRNCNHEKTAGEGVNVYILDTGVDVDNLQFEGRASWGVTIPEGKTDVDENGRGTDLAGTFASQSFGVIKKANVTVLAPWMPGSKCIEAGFLLGSQDSGLESVR